MRFKKIIAAVIAATMCVMSMSALAASVTVTGGNVSNYSVTEQIKMTKSGKMKITYTTEYEDARIRLVMRDNEWSWNTVDNPTKTTVDENTYCVEYDYDAIAAVCTAAGYDISKAANITATNWDEDKPATITSIEWTDTTAETYAEYSGNKIDTLYGNQSSGTKVDGIAEGDFVEAKYIDTSVSDISNAKLVVKNDDGLWAQVSASSKVKNGSVITARYSCSDIQSAITSYNTTESKAHTIDSVSELLLTNQGFWNGTINDNDVYTIYITENPHIASKAAVSLKQNSETGSTSASVAVKLNEPGKITIKIKDQTIMEYPSSETVEAGKTVNFGVLVRRLITKDDLHVYVNDSEVYIEDTEV